MAEEEDSLKTVTITITEEDSLEVVLTTILVIEANDVLVHEVKDEVAVVVVRVAVGVTPDPLASQDHVDVLVPTMVVGDGRSQLAEVIVVAVLVRNNSSNSNNDNRSLNGHRVSKMMVPHTYSIHGVLCSIVRKVISFLIQNPSFTSVTRNRHISNTMTMSIRRL